MSKHKRDFVSYIGVVIAFFLGKYFTQITNTENIIEWLYMQIPALRIIAFIGTTLCLVAGYWRLRQSKKDADANIKVIAIKYFLYAFIFAIIGLVSCFL